MGSPYIILEKNMGSGVNRSLITITRCHKLIMIMCVCINHCETHEYDIIIQLNCPDTTKAFALPISFPIVLNKK